MSVGTATSIPRRFAPSCRSSLHRPAFRSTLPNSFRGIGWQDCELEAAVGRSDHDRPFPAPSFVAEDSVHTVHSLRPAAPALHCDWRWAFSTAESSARHCAKGEDGTVNAAAVKGAAECAVMPPSDGSHFCPMRTAASATR